MLESFSLSLQCPLPPPTCSPKLFRGRKRWRDQIRSHVADYSLILQGYLRWRLSQAMERWPGREKPRQVILASRLDGLSLLVEGPEQVDFGMSEIRDFGQQKKIAQAEA